MTDDRVQELTARLREFAEVRDWPQLHTPKNLAMAIAGEAGELAAVLQWATGDEEIGPYMDDLRDELADVFIYAARLADVLGVDLIEIAHAKIDRNETRFPPPPEESTHRD